MEKKYLKLSVYLSTCLAIGAHSVVSANSLAITAEELAAMKILLAESKPAQAPSPKAEKIDTPVASNKVAKKGLYIPTEHLLKAISTNNLKKVKSLIKQGADLTPGRGEPLTKAVQNQNLDIVKELLRHKADPNQEGFSYESSGVLGTAVKMRNLELVKLLLKYKADPNIGNEYIKMNDVPDTPLYIAVQKRDVAIAQVLLKAGADIHLPYPISLQSQVSDRKAVTTRNILNHINPRQTPKLYRLFINNGAKPILH